MRPADPVGILIASSGKTCENAAPEEESTPSNTHPHSNPKSMKHFLSLAIALTMIGSANAGCGIKIPVSGKLASYDKEKKELKVGEQAITLAAAAKIIGADGKEVKIEDLVGKEVTVSTDKHNKKGESVTAKKAG